MPGLALQLGPVPDGHILPLSQQPGMSWQCRPSAKPFGYGGQGARHIPGVSPARSMDWQL